MLEVPGALMKSVSQASWSASICACAEQGVSGAQECAYPRMVLEHNDSEGVGVPKCACAGEGTRSTGCVCQQQVLTAPELECVSQAGWSTSNVKLYVRVPKVFGSTRVCWIQSVSV